MNARTIMSRHVLVTAGLCLITAVSCDEPGNPNGGFGSIALQIVSAPTVSPAASDGAVPAAATAQSPSAPSGALALEGVRVTVNGPTPKTATSTTASGGFFDVTLDQLTPGQYTVIVEGIVNSETDFYGSVSSVNVTAGQTAAATVTNFATFVPVLADFNSPTALSTITAKWSKVPTATGYVLQVANNAAFTGATERSVPDTSAVVTAPDTGLFYVRVRASNATVAKGRATVAGTKQFRVVPVASSLRVTPAGGTLVGAGSQQTLTAQGYDATNAPIFDLTYAWTSLNTNVATVGASSGQVTAVANGQAIVRATLGSLAATSVVSVDAMPAPPVNVWTAISNPSGGSYIWTIWGTSPTNVFAAVGNGNLMRFDGSSWSLLTHPAVGTLRGVWGSSDTDIFAVGIGGVIQHSVNGTNWTSMTSGSTAYLFGVWGSSPTNVFAVGQGGTILHYDGAAWNAVPASGTVTTQDLWYVWGTAANNVYATGNGTILHYDGTAWSSMTLPAAGAGTVIFRVWGPSANNLFAVGDGGVILRCNGSTWTEDPQSQIITTTTLAGIWGTSANEVYASGSGTLLRYNGTTWSQMPTGTSGSLWHTWGMGSTQVLAVGFPGLTMKGIRGAAPAIWGETSTTLTSTSTASSNVLFSTPFVVTSKTEVTQIRQSIRATTTATKVRYAIYSDNAGMPNTLLAQTDSISIAGATAATYDVPLLTPNQLQLAPGTYWLSSNYGTPGVAFPFETTGGAGYVGGSLVFNTAFPVTYPVASLVAGYRINQAVTGFLVP